jgi:hypothetical protein
MEAHGWLRKMLKMRMVMVCVLNTALAEIGMMFVPLL